MSVSSTVISKSKRFSYFANTKLKTSGISEVVTQVSKKCSSDWSSSEDRTLLVSLMHCLFEAQDDSLCQLVASKLNHKLILENTRLNPTDCYYLSYFLTFCDDFDVDLSQCSIGDDHCKYLFRSGQVYNFHSLEYVLQVYRRLHGWSFSSCTRTHTCNLQPWNDLDTHAQSASEQRAQLRHKQVQILCFVLWVAVETSIIDAVILHWQRRSYGCGRGHEDRY